MTSQSAGEAPAQIAIVGGGIVGLVLAIGLKKHLNLTPEIFEAAHEFVDDVGAGMGIYPNGLRVLRDLSPDLFDAVKNAGHPYLYRRWERHDGTEVAVAEENVLSDRDDNMQTIGIRRWRLQKVLYDTVCDMGIPIHFAKRTKSVQTRPDGTVEILFEDGTTRLTQILFGADGSKSKVRESVAECGAKLEYTGVTCLMGIADDTQCTARGICLPSSTTSHCHGAFFPTGEYEQCFQVRTSFTCIYLQRCLLQYLTELYLA
jgi:salicylate hydroxylase